MNEQELLPLQHRVEENAAYQKNFIEFVNVYVEQVNAILIKFAEAIEQKFWKMVESVQAIEPKPTRKKKFHIMQAKVKHLRSQVILNKPQFIRVRSCL